MKESRSLDIIKPYVSRLHLAILSGLQVVSSILLVLVAFMTKAVIDAIIVGDSGQIITYISIAIAMLFAYAITLFVTNYLTAKFTLISTKAMVSDTHNHLLRCPYSSVTSSHSMEHLKVVTSDADIAISTYIKLFPTITGIVTKLVLGIALMIYVSYTITLIALAIGLVLCVGLMLIKKPMKCLHKRVQEKVASSNAYMQESLKNIEVVKALDMSTYIKGGVETRLGAVQKAVLSKATLSSVLSSIVYFLLEITFLMVLVFGGSLIVSGKLTLSQFIVLISLIEVVKSPFLMATNLSNSIYSMLASAERVKVIRDIATEQYIDADFDEIVVDDVSYSYDDEEVISHLSLNIKRGDTLLVRGKSGSGKSTFMRLLIGIIKPTSGEIYLVKDGVRASLGDGLLRLSYAPQNMGILSDTVWNNLTFGRDISRERVEDALKIARIYDDIISLDKGFDYMLGEGGNGLSQGQIERLAIARALLSDEPILMLDEPFASLDKAVACEIFDGIKKMDKTIIIASHDEFLLGEIKSQIII